MQSLLAHLSSLSPAAVYLTLAGILLACGLGLPMPEDISLISAGYVAHLGIVNVHKVLAVCFLSVLGGDLLAFALGRYFGRKILSWKTAMRFFTPRKQRRVRAYFRKFGSKVIFIGRFLPGLRFSIFFSAGMMHVRPTVFLLFDTMAAALSVPALVYLAYVSGDKIDHVVAWARRSEYGILVFALVVAGVLAIKIVRARRHRAAHCFPAAKVVPPGGTVPQTDTH